MKKKLSLFVASILAIIVLPAVSFAAPLKNTITGTVYYNGVPTSGAHVTVYCYPKNTSVIQKTTTSKAGGAYSVKFTNTKCATGDTISVYAFVKIAHHRHGGTSSGVVGQEGPFNVYIGDAVAVPE